MVARMADTKPPQCPAPAALSHWLQANGVNLKDFAADMPTSRQTLHRWLSGDARPKAAARRKIAKRTDGFVPESQWLLASEL